MIWLIGNKGMLGKEISAMLAENNIEFTGTDKDVDITSLEALKNFALDKKIEYIINCSAYTAVDKAENDKELAFLLNVKGVENIAITAKEKGARLIHISTDYVFDGNADVPYTEDMQKNPAGIYGITKSGGEDAAASVFNEWYILRTAWLYGFDGKNFVYTITNAMNSRDSIKVVCDQYGSPTFTKDAANAIIKIIQNNSIPFGIYHCTDLGETNWFEFTEEILRLGKKYGRIKNDCKIIPCSTEEYPTPAKRPAYSVLSKDKIQKALNIKLPQWQQSLENFIKDGRFNPL